MGDELIGNSQIKEIYTEQNGVAGEYFKGQIQFKNGIDKLKYLLDHRTRIAQLIGIDVNTIIDNKRNLTKIKEYLNQLNNVCEIGESQDPIQLYISKHNNNTQGLDSSFDWVDYILTQKWIDKLGFKVNGQEYSPTDYRIEYLSDLIEGILADHIIDYHTALEQIDSSDFIEQQKTTINGIEIIRPIDDAINKLNSFGKLEYGFYELFKPIGGGNGKFIKVKISTNGYIDLSGVVDLSDCSPFAWEYGSEAYLRSLNTGNQRYLFQLDIPFNDTNSSLWWRPDEPEKLNEHPSSNDSELKPTIEYYKEYEIERFLRWFGTDHIPSIDETTLEKCTVCSSPILSTDTKNGDFYNDAKNIGQIKSNIPRININDSTSQSLLSLQPKATIALKTYVKDDTDEENPIYRLPQEDDAIENIHQYLEFIVTGNRQTSNLAFNVKGRIGTDIQEKHHYLNTLGQITNEMERLFNITLFLTVSQVITPGINTIWKKLNKYFWEDALLPDEINNNVISDKDLIPQNWVYIENKLQELLKSPTIVDVLRFRQIDWEAIGFNIDTQIAIRVEKFLQRLNNPTFIDEYCYGDKATIDNLKTFIKNNPFIQELYNYINNYKNATYQDELDNDYNGITQLTNDQKINLIVSPLEKMYGKKMSKSESQNTRIKFSSDGDWFSYNINGALTESILKKIGLLQDEEDDELPVERDHLLWLHEPYMIEIGTDVTSIADNIFAGCKSLIEIKLPTSVETIGKNCFKDCTKLENIEFIGRKFNDVVDDMLIPINKLDNYPWGIENTNIINKGDFSNITVEILKQRITTFNNLIVRLPVGPSRHNCIVSKHIFQDWKTFVDGAKAYLIERNQLFTEVKTGIGTDGKEYTYDELFIDENKTIPLIDYDSYISIDPETGLPNADRWDYWNDDDFKWPQ